MNANLVCATSVQPTEHNGAAGVSLLRGFLPNKRDKCSLGGLPAVTLRHDSIEAHAVVQTAKGLINDDGFRRGRIDFGLVRSFKLTLDLGKVKLGDFAIADLDGYLIGGVVGLSD